MTDPLSERPNGAPIEPWALDLLEGQDASPEARDELSHVISLLRNLEDPTQDPERVDRILARLDAERARPGVIRAISGAGRRALQPPVALALAAGMAGVFAMTFAPGGLPQFSPEAAPTESIRVATSGPVAPTVPVAESDGVADPSQPGVFRRSTPVIRPHLVNVSGFSASSVTPPQRLAPTPFNRQVDQNLDRQLNQLMIDPHAFAIRLERVVQNDRFISRLAQRAAERGDAPAIALRVRESGSRHPLANRLVERLLRATVVASAARR